MIIQKKLTMKQALEEISFSILKRHLPDGFDHSQIVCEFENNEFIVTVLDKEEMKSLN